MLKKFFVLVVMIAFLGFNVSPIYATPPGQEPGWWVHTTGPANPAWTNIQDDIDDRILELINEYGVGEKGDKGDKGDPGKDGLDGKDGINGLDGELITV